MGIKLHRAAAAVLSLVFAASSLGSDAVLIEFSSQQCPPCRAMVPVISRMAGEGVAVRRVDVDREPQLAQRWGIRQTPTFLVVSGGKELTRLVGMQSAEQLRQALALKPGGAWVDTNAVRAAHEAAPGGRAAFDSPEYAPPQSRQSPAMSPGGEPAPISASGSMPLSEAMPSESVADAVERAQAATVRLRVHDQGGHGVGTGTIIDTHGDEALVLTCGHLFRDTQGQGRIEVDLFIGGRPQTVEGTLIDYDADNRDIALVAIRPGYPVQPVPVIRAGKVPEVGSAAFSFGCDRGDDPSRRDTRITGVNKYNQHKKASNLEIAGAPIDGRSGGGLFDSEGFLIGVCNAADFQGDIGIYTGPGSVHWQLDRVQLSRLYDPSGQDPAVAGNREAEIAPSDEFAAPPERLASRGEVNGLGVAEPSAAGDDREVIVIIRDRSNPHGASRVVTLTQPTGELLQMLDQQVQ